MGGGVLKIVGRAVPFGRPSEPKYGKGRAFRDVILPGAFSESILDGGFTLCWTHQAEEALASTRDGSLRVWEEADGLRFAAEPYGTPEADAALDALRLHKCLAVSVRYWVCDEKWDFDRPEPLREAARAILDHIAILPPSRSPGFPGTEARIVICDGDALDEIEEWRRLLDLLAK
jgi:HK97 family phage prohead protease